MPDTSRTLAIYMPDLEARHLEELLNVAGKIGFDARVISRTPTDDDKAYLANCEILFTQKPKVIALCGKNLRWVHTSFAGIDAFCAGGAYDGIIPAGVMLTNNTGAYGVSVAEHMLMLALMLCRGEDSFMRDQVAHTWGPHLEQGTIYGATIGVLGCGDIGINFAKQVRGMGAGKIIGISKSGIARVEGLFDEMVPADELDTVLPRIDILGMSIPGAGAHDCMLDARRLALLPKHALVINAGRGSAIDEAALLAALETGELAGAGLDVFAEEPLPASSPLWDAPHCIVTPHVAGNMTATVTRDETVRLFIEDFERYAQGLTPRRVIDLQRGY